MLLSRRARPASLSSTASSRNPLVSRPWSLVRPCSRLTSYEFADSTTVSTRRQALQPFSLSNGARVSVGDWLCTPVQALMQTEQHYPQALAFNGFRFVDPALFEKNDMAPNETFQAKSSRLTDVSSTFHVWGTGRMAW